MLCCLQNGEIASTEVIKVLAERSLLHADATTGLTCDTAPVNGVVVSAHAYTNNKVYLKHLACEPTFSI